MHGDERARVVTWGGQSSLGLSDKRPVVLQFRLRCAELFAVEWA